MRDVSIPVHIGSVQSLLGLKLIVEKDLNSWKTSVVVILQNREGFYRIPLSHSGCACVCVKLYHTVRSQSPLILMR